MFCKMFPTSLPATDFSYLLTADAVHNSQISMQDTGRRSDGDYVSLSQFSLVGFLAAQVASLCNLVSHVVGYCPEKKVFRVEAKPVVASMADEQPIRYFGAVDFVRYAMRLSEPSINHDGTVTIGIFCPNPVPASGLFIDLDPRKQTVTKGHHVRHPKMEIIV